MFYNIVAGAIALATSLFLHLDTAQQGALNVAVTAIGALIVAFAVKGGTWGAALVGTVQPLAAAAFAFNLRLDPAVQGAALLLVTAIAGYATRPIVDAPEAPAVPGSSVIA